MLLVLHIHRVDFCQTYVSRLKLGDRRFSPTPCYVPERLNPSVLEKPVDTSTQSFFSEIVASISDIKSTSDGRYIVSRDYMTLKLWDVNMEARPVKTINVHEHLRPQVRVAKSAAHSELGVELFLSDTVPVHS